MNTTETHDVVIKLQRAFNEYRPDCSCGWVGSYWSLYGAAYAEAWEHRALDKDAS